MVRRLRSRIGVSGWALGDLAGILRGLLMLGLVVAWALPAWAQPASTQPAAEADAEEPAEVTEAQAELPAVTEPCLLVSEFELRYLSDDPQYPPIESLLSVPLELGVAPEGYVAARAGLERARFTLAEVPGLAMQQFCPSALQSVSEQLASHLIDQGLMGVYIRPAEADITISPGQDAQGRPVFQVTDLRQDTTRLRYEVMIGTITVVRTVASGERVPDEDRLDNPVHQRILSNSPLGPNAQTHLIRREVLEEYIYRLNRHPSRHVTAVLAPAEEVGQAELQYLVRENKPWLLYAQVLNNGTDSTGEWRQRFGFVHRQLTDNDDIFTVDYITSCFTGESQGVVASYEAPVWRLDRLRYRLMGSWSEFDASEVGFADDRFTGSSTTIGAELILNVFQYQDFFIDVFSGARWRKAEVENFAADMRGRSEFFLPTVGLRWERITRASSLYGMVAVEHNCAGLAGTDTGEDLERLGRLNTDSEWTLLSWDAQASYFIDALWKSPEAVETGATLAHELFFSVRGQYAWDDARLVPEFEQVVGGLYTVRGYEESIVAADNVIVASVEYRLHLPRLLKPSSKPQSVFNRPVWLTPGGAPRGKDDSDLSPTNPPDWDLVLRGFLDVGTAQYNESLATEEDETLMSVGIGVELQLLKNVNLRLDWGHALRDAREVEEGDERVHFVATIVW